MAVNLSPLAGAGWQFFDNDGVPLAGGRLYTYLAGTTTAATTYTSSSGADANPNPIILDSTGRVSNEVWITEGQSIKFILNDSVGNLIWSKDDIFGINDQTEPDANLSAFEANLANTTDIAKGDALVGFKQAGPNGYPAGVIARTVHAKLTEFVSVDDFGAVGNGTTDDTTAFQLAINFVQNSTNKQMVIKIPAKSYLIEGTLSVTGSVRFQGEGYLDFENTRPITQPGKGSWLIHDNLTEPLITFSGDLGKDSGLFDIAIFQTGHGVPATAWTPTPHNWVINNTNTQGTLYLVRVHFHNVYRGVNTINAYRPHYEDITGQFFYRAFSFDQMYDVGKFEGLHAWTYWSENTDVLQYQQANCVAITLLRVDGLFLDRIFTFAVETAIYVGNSASGTAKAIFINNLYADFTGRGLVVDATLNAEIQVANIWHLGQAWPGSPVAALSNSAAVDISSGSNHIVQIANLRSVLTNTYGVRVIGSNNRLWIDNPIIEQYDFSNSGKGAFYATSPNLIYLGTQAGIARYDATTPYLMTGAPGGLILGQTKQVTSDNNVNTPITATSDTGDLAVVTVEGETDAGLAVLAKNAGQVNIGAATNKLGFFEAGGVLQPTVTGSTGGNVALQNLCSALAQLGLIINTTT